jgi:DNA-binding response OmpR family regulator
LPEPRPRALIADGDPSTERLLSQHLVSEGFSIDSCADGRDALERAVASKFDLIVIDSALAGFDGIALCRAIRQAPLNRDAAIFVVAAKASESDKILTLICGADDYLAKPVNVREFLARLSVIRRRTGQAERAPRDRVEHNGLCLDPARRQVVVRGTHVRCSKQEFDLLYHLASSPGIVFSREELFTRHWAHTNGGDVRLVDPIVSRLRRKIEQKPGVPQLILTVWGIGYKFSDQ